MEHMKIVGDVINEMDFEKAIEIARTANMWPRRGAYWPENILEIKTEDIINNRNLEEKKELEKRMKEFKEIENSLFYEEY